jgi:hypothetical protein
MVDLKVELIDAEIQTLERMLLYIDTVKKDKDLNPIQTPEIELMHIQMLQEFILRDEIEMATSDFEM